MGLLSLLIEQPLIFVLLSIPLLYSIVLLYFDVLDPVIGLFRWGIWSLINVLLP
jgi:hypothetical protein